MSLQLYPDATGDLRNAKYLATASELAYLDSSEGPDAYKEKLGLDAKLISQDNTQVYVGTDDNNIVLAFRGSESPTNIDGLKDWLLTNANNFLVPPEGDQGADFLSAGVDVRVHRGFVAALSYVWEPMYQATKEAMEEKERPLWVTGHSLGGALALLAAWRLKEQFLPVHQVYTFGAPMIGNELLAEAYGKEFPDKIFRFVDGEDPVPLLPFVGMVAHAYKHCLNEVPLRVLESSGGSTLEVLRGFSDRVVEGVLNATLVDEIWEALLGRVEAHLMPNYHTRLDEKEQEG